MLTHPAKASATIVGLQLAGPVAGTLVLLLALLATMRPEMMMSMTAIPRLMSAVGL